MPASSVFGNRAATALTAEAPAGASLSPLVRCSKPDIASGLHVDIETIREQMKNIKHLSYYNCCHGFPQYKAIAVGLPF